MNELEVELSQKIYPPLMNHILFFNTWKDPENFFTMSRAERLKLYGQMKQHSHPPTQSNHWIWFGSYAGRVPSPRYDNNSVAKHLFEILISPAEGKRILPSFLSSRADVNPFKFAKAVGLTLQQRSSLFKNMTGQNPPVKTPSQDQLELIQICKDELDQLFYPDACDTKLKMREALLRNGHTEFAIVEAFKLSMDKDWKTTA